MLNLRPPTWKLYLRHWITGLLGTRFLPWANKVPTCWKALCTPFRWTGWRTLWKGWWGRRGGHRGRIWGAVSPAGCFPCARQGDPLWRTIEHFDMQCDVRLFFANSNCYWSKWSTWFVSANHSCCLRKQMKIKLHVERLYYEYYTITRKT